MRRAGIPRQSMLSLFGEIMDFSVNCEICGKSYDNYHLTWKFSGKTLCMDCFTDELTKAEYWFYPHVPPMCDGCDVTLRTFDNLEDIFNFLKTIPRKDEVLAYGDSNEVMTVSKNGKNWWVHGYTNCITQLDLPFWKDIAKS